MKHKNNTGAIRFWGISLFLALWAWPLLTAAQLPAGIRLRAKTTGKSSGEVAVYHLKNRTNAPITATLGPFIIQKKPRLQPLYLSQAAATIPPGSRLSITATGACIDFSRPLPPAGARLSYPRHFFTVDEMLPIGPTTSLAGQAGVTLVPEGHDGITLTFPGTTEIFPYRISPDANPGLFYSYVFAVEEAFGETFPLLKAQGSIETVFSFDPVLEENLLRQVLTWAITSELSGQDYGPDVLTEQIARVYAETYEIDVKDIPESVSREVEGNSYNIWEEVFALGEGAKLLKAPDSVNVYGFRDLIRDISKLDPRDSLFIDKVIELILSGFRIPGPDGKDIAPVMSEADLSRLSSLLEAKRKENERLHPEVWEASKPLRPGSDKYWEFWLLSRKDNGFCCEKSGKITFSMDDENWMIELSGK